MLDPAGDFLTAGPARVVIFTTSQTSKDQLERLRSGGAEVHILGDLQVNLIDALETLYQVGIRRLMVEGGGTLNFELLRLGLVDELMLYVAPLVFGGFSAPTLAAGAGLVRDQAIPLDLVDVEKWDDGGVLLHYKPVILRDPTE
jgi:2,5-diamino-6-(ribosylamino)-4(3H)-pyrimidinone 5'-phosphate reductase